MTRPKVVLPLAGQIALIALVPLIYQVLRNSTGILATQLEQQFSMSATAMGVIAGAVSLGAMLAILPAAAWVNRFGARPVLLYATALIALGAVGYALAPDPMTLFIARFCIGLGSGPYLAAAMARAEQDTSSNQFKEYSGEISAIGRSGSVLAAAPFAIIVAWLGWRQTIALLAAAALLLVLILWLSASNTKRQPQTNTIPWRQLLCGSVLARLCLLMALMGSISTLIGLWGGPWLASAYSLNPHQISWYLTLLTASFAFGSISSISLTRWFGKATLSLLISTAIALLLLLASPVQLPPTLLLFILAALGCCLSPTVLVLAELRQAAPTHLVVALLAVSSLAFSMGIFLFQAISGIVVDVFARTSSGGHPTIAFQWVFVVLAVGLLLTLIMRWCCPIKSAP
ncbi:MAG: MFS transporter [Ferrimonas sp.]